jgi:DNA modification methylase
MKTTHKIYFKNANDMADLSDCSVDLMVTSPPYPMVEMWDEIFSKQNPTIKTALTEKDGNLVFELMNQELDKVWKEAYRVLRKGGFACINIGDATRKIGEEFKNYMNHSRILQSCSNLGFSSLPTILWRKQTNAPNKFMGSGMLPSGAYVTLEHEFILVLRKGSRRVFTNDEDKKRRRKSAFFWEERNLWFSDMWKGLKGTRQNNINKTIRNRSGAYPFELAYRIINMYSMQEDIVLDPFLGTGTTIIASIAAGRNSIGFEIDPNLKDHIIPRIKKTASSANQILKKRIEDHLLFVKEREKIKKLGYVNKNYGFPVMTRQETELIFNEIATTKTKKDDTVEVEYLDEPSFKIKEGKFIQKGNESNHS